MEIQELRDCTDERLVDLEKTLRRQIFDARIKNYTNQLDDTASIRRSRRDLARVKTILSERRNADPALESAGPESAPESGPESSAPESGDTETSDE